MKLSKIIIAIIVASFAFIGCEKDEESTYNLSLELKYPEKYGNSPVSNFEITITNVTTENSQKISTDELGVATVSGLAKGTYNIQGSVVLKAESAKSISNIKQPLKVNFSLLNFLVDDSMLPTTAVEVATAIESSLIISEIYANPNMLNAMKSGFIEIYNNSDQEVVLDGKYIAIVSGSSNEGFGDPLNINSDNLYYESLIQIPGSGSEYIIQPHSFFVIAQNANEFTYMDPTTYETLPGIDLTIANLEVNSVEYNNNRGLDAGTMAGVLYFDTDNPSVPNANLVKLGMMNWWTFNPSLASSILLFDAKDATKDFSSAEYKLYEASTNNSFALKKSEIDVIDAVDFMMNSKLAAYKNFPSNFDAGFSHLEGDDVAYKMKSISRKRDKDASGKLIFIDSDNSSNDFEETDPNAGN